MDYYNQTLQQLISFNKTAFDNGFNALMALQNQAEKMVNSYLEQATWIPEEGKKVIDDWNKAYKKGCQDSKKLVDENFRRAEGLFVGTQKATKTKTRKVSKA